MPISKQNKSLLILLLAMLGLAYVVKSWKSTSNKLPQVQINQKNLEKKVEFLSRKIRPVLKDGEFILDFNDYSDQKKWINRYYKLILLKN